MQSFFGSFAELQNHFTEKGHDALTITYLPLKDYKGMALAIMIDINLKKDSFKLDLQWMSLGLDLYGDTLQESYVYSFSSLSSLLEYLQTKYSISVTDIPKVFKFDADSFPNPIKNSSEKFEFEIAWEKFQQDFRNDVFLDLKQILVYK